MNKYFIFFIILSFCSCIDDENTNTQKNNLIKNKKALTQEMIANFKFTDILLDPKAKVIAQNWSSYQSIEDGINLMKVLNYNFFKTNDAEFNTIFNELNANIPEAFKTQAITSRLLVLQTKLYRFKDELSFSPQLDTTHSIYVKDVFVAFSNLNLQINKKLEKEAQVIIKPE